MATIQQRGDRFTATIRRKGHKSLSKTLSTRKKAETWARRTETKIEDGEIFATSRKTLHEAIERYRESIATKLKTFDHTVLDWWDAELGATELRYLRRSQFVAAREKLRGTESSYGGNLSPATVNRRVARISGCLTWVRDELEWIRDNPARIRYLPEDNERSDADVLLTPKQLSTLLVATAKSSEPALLPFVLTVLVSGARAGEIVNLCWRDVDLARGLATLRNTKNGSTRVVPIRGPALDALAARRVDQDPDELVFSNKHSPGKRFRYRHYWEKARRTAGFERSPSNGGNYRLHDLRHLNASMLAMAGVTQTEVMKILGHRSPLMTRRYSHLFDQHITDLGDRVVQRLFDGEGSWLTR